ncbi:HEPN domain-containing protein [Erythrobacter sp. YT30]|uniref:HEPN domain-containing protein n=1 Tax=Erythrobacter sp. YT30 TaxID=1735012 RepID=UPI00076DECC7|nr:HEPN domain-containing protein [Erythrobacter sp. YT30]KWV91955.1 hypothetical protein AUC45_12395 [Erythrobacter sp. YT30]
MDTIAGRQIERIGHLGLPVIRPKTVEGPNTLSGIEKSLVLKLLHDAEGQKVLSEIRSKPEVLTLEGKMIATSYGGRTLFDVRLLACWWIWRANYVGRNQANAELDAYLSADNIEVDLVEWLQGVEVDGSIDLGLGYQLAPAKDYYDVDEKEALLKFDLSGHELQDPAASAILKRTVQLSKAVSKDEDNFDSAARRSDGHEMYLAVMLLNCQSSFTANSVLSTSHIQPNTPPFRFHGGGGRIGERQKHLSNGKVMPDAKLFNDMMSSARRWDDHELDFYLTAMKRLSSAKASRSGHDFALDLGIALEMMLFKGDRSKSEIRNKFAARGAWLLAKDVEDRTSLFGALLEIYDFRSRVAHGGALNLRAKQWHAFRKSQAEQVLIAESVFQKVISEGEPDWKRLVLGG